MPQHHGGIERRLAPLAAIGASDLGKVNLVSHQAQHKAGEMVLGHKVLHRLSKHVEVSFWAADGPISDIVANFPVMHNLAPMQGCGRV